MISQFLCGRDFAKWNTLVLPIWRLELIINKLEQNYLSKIARPSPFKEVEQTLSRCKAQDDLMLENDGAGACFSKAPESFRACKAIFRSPVSKNGEVFMPETSYTKGTFLHL